MLEQLRWKRAASALRSKAEFKDRAFGIERVPASIDVAVVSL